MTIEARPAQTTEHRSLLWWFSVVLAPIGLFGGPIEIANMVSGVVQWHGPIGYLVNFWSENISVHFANVFGLLTNLVHIPPLSDFVVSYLTLGILLCTSFLRAAAMISARPVFGASSGGMFQILKKRSLANSSLPLGSLPS